MASSRSIRFIARRPVDMTGVSAPGYSVREVAKGAFQHAPGTKRFRRIGKDPGAAFPADSDYPDHCRVARARSLLYSVKFFHALRLEDGDEMSQLVLDIAGGRHRVSNLLS